jgi:hypothetical protein
MVFRFRPAIFSSSVIVRNFHFVGVSFAPHEAQAILVIDPYAVLALPIPFQPFQPVPRWNSQIAYRAGRIQNLQFF